MTSTPRRPSVSIPSIFTHVGVRSPSMSMSYASPGPNVPLSISQTLDSTASNANVQGAGAQAGHEAALQPIAEAGTASAETLNQGTGSAVPVVLEKEPSAIMQLPLLIIAQYGLLALHTTTHDQVFLSYLVS